MLFLVFLVLKLTAVIVWSWWWITAPIWIPSIPGILFLVFMLLAMLTGGKRKKAAKTR